MLAIEKQGNQGMLEKNSHSKDKNHWQTQPMYMLKYLYSQTWLTVICKMKLNKTKWKFVLCEICILWNENLYFAEWKSVFHEMMKIFIFSQNIDNFSFHSIFFRFVSQITVSHTHLCLLYLNLQQVVHIGRKHALSLPCHPCYPFILFFISL